ncbi:RNA polymerase sigma factor [Paenibacillus alkalitolerans]|uniref:RNA polymerase sigma factor n=1 Tax=Paenibacillus alkalitolerans TaxID=2799335 RepID=UPI0018F723E7|nr:RNA polymerase sigma factor [Paenibacillus alkalitolerans]
MAAANSGVRGAFLETFMSNQAALKRYCYIKTCSQWDAEDLLQETLIKAFRWHERHPDREITRTFLFRIAANAWIDGLNRSLWLKMEPNGFLI